MSNKQAWVTLATNDTYCLGALVLAHSLKKVNTKYDLVILITSNVTTAMRGALQSVFNEVKEVNIIDSGDSENLRLLARPELGITFTKLHCWRLTQYEKCVFLDADTLVLQNCDDLFEREELSAAPDVGWPDCFNSGVFVFKPSEETYKAIVDFALANGSFDGGDQGLLNMYFSYWSTADSSKRLPFLYNLSSAAIYSYLPAFKWYGKGVKIVHFIGSSKPWLQSFNTISRTVSTSADSAHLINFLQYWWNLFCGVVYPHLSPEMTGLALSLSQMKLEEPTPEQLAQDDLLRRQNWEHGNIDYMGRDSFDNILNKISQTISQQTESKPADVSETPSATEKSLEPSSTAPSDPTVVSEPKDAVAKISSESDVCSLKSGAEKSTSDSAIPVTEEVAACPLPPKEQPTPVAPLAIKPAPAPVAEPAAVAPESTIVPESAPLPSEPAAVPAPSSIPAVPELTPVSPKPMPELTPIPTEALAPAPELAPAAAPAEEAISCPKPTAAPAVTPPESSPPSQTPETTEKK